MKNYYYEQILKYIDFIFHINYIKNFDDKKFIFDKLISIINFNYFYINTINKKEFEFIQKKLLIFLHNNNL